MPLCSMLLRLLQWLSTRNTEETKYLTEPSTELVMIFRGLSY
jgi:hypothetical protein